jgi:hypothetical protein
MKTVGRDSIPPEFRSDDPMSLSPIEKSLLIGAYFRGNIPGDRRWTSSSDQIVTLSLFYTGDISATECATRFSVPRYVQGLYDDEGELRDEIWTRYKALIQLLRDHPEYIEGGGNFETPADPTYTACRLTEAGVALAKTFIPSFAFKPEFPDWPDRRTFHPEN